MLFQLVEIEVDGTARVVAETRTQPLFELHQDAMAMAEFAAARRAGDYGYDPETDCWWASRDDGCSVRFVVRPVLDAAA